jgi:beta-galactosidase
LAARIQLPLVRSRRAGTNDTPRQPATPSMPITIGDAELIIDDGRREALVVAFPALSLYRAPTDNDAPPGNNPDTAANRWQTMGVDRLRVDDRTARRTKAGLTLVTTYGVDAGRVVHTQRLRARGDAIEISDEVELPDTFVDVPRVGIVVTLPGDFDDLSWFGLGPGDSYPDRRAAVTLGRWDASIRDQVVPFVVPQEFGLHLDTRWFSIASDNTAVRFTPAKPMAFSALPVSIDDLAAASHPHRLPERADTFIHLDVAHRGLGTAACGPDTAERWRITPGTYRWRWSMGAAPRPT